MKGLFRRRRAATTAVVWLLLGACQAAESEPSSFSVDTLKSGQIVVRNGMHAPPRDSGWQLELLARIGAEERPEDSPFWRVCDVALDTGPTLYVLDCLAAEIRVFNSRGEQVRTIGRRGNGPGEFDTPFALAFDGEGSLWVADEGLQRYTVITTNGEAAAILRRPIRWPSNSGALRVSRDGILYEYGWWSNGPGGVIRISIDTIPSVLDTVTLSPWASETLPHRQRPGFDVAVPFSAHPVVGVGPDGEVWTGSGQEYRFVRITAEGDTAKLVELNLDAQPLSQAAQRSAQEMLAELETQGFVADARRIPTSHASFTAMSVSANGEVWLHRAAHSSSAAAFPPAMFDVFSSAGEYLASLPTQLVDAPAPDVSGEFLAGVVRDDLDREFVELYRIRRTVRTSANGLTIR